MHDHHDKAIDIARAALASTRRGPARAQRRRIHRAERARARAELRAVARDGDDHLSDLRYEDRTAIRSMVAHRRDADAVGPLLAWAEATIRAVPGLADADWHAKHAFFLARLPDTTAGRHAADHATELFGDPPVHHELWWRLTHPEPSRGVPIDRVRAAVTLVLDAGAHGELNRRIKQADRAGGRHRSCYTGHPRLLEGIHDTDAFATGIHHCLEQRVLLDLTDELSGLSRRRGETRPRPWQDG